MLGVVRLSEEFGEWLARAEILAYGAEAARQAAARALRDGRLSEARSLALTILDDLPGSRVALALWADAAEAMGLDAEAHEALERLSGLLPFRADVWLRLARASARTGREPERELERAAEATEPAVAADEARLWLADRDLAAGDAARAERWLEQLSFAGRQTPQARRRHIEAWLALGEVARARAAAEDLPGPAALDGRGWLVQGRLLELEGADPAPAFRRALLLDTPGSADIVSGYVARVDAARASEILNLVKSLGVYNTPVWRAAFATAQGRPDEALAALAEGARESASPELVRRYLTQAIETRHPQALREAVRLAQRSGERVDSGVLALDRALGVDTDRARLDALDDAAGAAALWAEAWRREIYAGWVAADSHAQWDELLAELGALARRHGEAERVSEVAAIAVERVRPLSVAVVGEFNAGKSTFINALLGEDVAPVGALPTTATVNRLAWAPDRFARIEMRLDQHDRIVSHAELSATLRGLDARSIRQVTIYAPLELLRRIELVDTPGFNAGDDAHASLGRQSFELAHAVIWLCDAAQPLKDSERQVLAELHALGLPVLVLVNKLDRLEERGVGEVLAHLVAGLRASNIELEAPPLALSARLALQGRGGDPDALARSRWAGVEALVEEVLAARSSALREHALRRRARAVALQLVAVTEERARARSKALCEHAARSSALGEAAARARGRRAELFERLLAELERRLAALGDDLKPVAGFEREPAARRFIASRARNAIGAELTRRAVGLLELEPETAACVERALEPRLSAMAGAAVPTLWAEPEPKRASGLSESLVEQVIEELGRVCGELAAEPAPASAEPLEARTRALAAAFG